MPASRRRSREGLVVWFAKAAAWCYRILKLIVLALAFSVLAVPFASCAPIAAPVAQRSANTAGSSGDLDLSSTARVFSPQLAPGQSVTLFSGSDYRSVGAGDRVTAAELKAVQQVLAGGAQHLILSNAGQAIGGTVRLQEAALSSMVIPAGVTALRDFATSSLNLSGALNNAGKFYAFSSSPVTTAAIISAASVFNRSGAVISTVLPPSLSQLTPAASKLNLNIVSASSILNEGTIGSSGSLSLVARDSIANASGVLASSAVIQAAEHVNLQAPTLVNSGLITAAGNIGIGGPAGAPLVINNLGGRLEALQGVIAIRSSSYVGAFDTSVQGGDFISKELNVFGGHGSVLMDVGTVSGLLNLQACAAHIQADTANLQFGRVDLSGDPTFISTGNLTLPAAALSQPYIAVAGGNIVVTPGFELNTSSGTADGGSVFLIAGANASLTGGNVVVTGRSATGGDVNLTGISGINTASSLTTNSGGDVTLLAFSSAPGSSQGGHVIVPAGATIKTGIAGSGGAGNLLAVAEAAGTVANPASISIGAFDGSSSSAGSSRINILTISPDITPANPLVIDAATGQKISGVIAAGSLQRGAVVTGSLTAPGGLVKILAGGAIALHGDIQGGAVELKANGTGTITQTAGTSIAGSSVLLSSGSGAIGTSAIPIASSSPSLTATTTGDVFLSSSAPLVGVGASTGANFNLQAPVGRIELLGDITASGALTLNAQSGVKAIPYIAANIPVGASPTGIAVSPKTNLVFVANTASNTVSEINTATNTVIRVIPLPAGAAPTGIAISPSGAFVYVANSGNDTVTQIDAATGLVLKNIPVAGSPNGIAFDSAGKTVFVASTLTNKVTFIDSATGNLTGTVLSVQSSPVALAFNNSNGLLYVGNRSSNSISIIDPIDHTVNNVAVPFSPVAFGPCPCGTKIFVADGVDGVHVFSAISNTVVANISLPAGSAPSGIGINPTGSLAFVANAGNGTISTIETLTNTVSSTTAGAGSYQAFGEYASFVNSHAVAYVSNVATNSVSFLSTPLLSGSQYSINSNSGQVNVVIKSGPVQASNPNGSVIITSANPITSLGGQAVDYQLATVGSQTVNAPIVGDVIDLHAINGVFTNNSTLTTTGPLLFIASPVIQIFGALVANNASGPTEISLQSPPGTLRVSLAAGAQLKSVAGVGVSSVILNPAGGKSINLTGATGSQITADFINLVGDPHRYTIDFRADQVVGKLDVPKNPTYVFIQNQSGDLSIQNLNLIQSSGGGSYALIAVPNGNLFLKALNANYSGLGPNATNVSLISAANITIDQFASAQGTNGANGGLLKLIAKGSISTPITSTNSINVSGRSGGTVLLLANNFQLAGKDGIGISVRSSGDIGTGGLIYIASSGPNALSIGTNVGANFIAGNVVSDGRSGGDVRVYASGFALSPSVMISASGGDGIGGRIVLRGSQPLTVVNDGTINASNVVANNSGIVAFDSSPYGNVVLTGTGTVHAGAFVSFGNLNPATLLPYDAIYLSPRASFVVGGVSAQQGSAIGNVIAVGLTTNRTIVREPDPQSVFRPVSSSQSASSFLIPNITLPSETVNPLIPTDKTPFSFSLPENKSVAVATGESLIETLQIRTVMAPVVPHNNVSISRIGANEFKLQLGRVFLAPDEDVLVETRFGTVSVAKGSVVVLNADSESLAIYNLFDNDAGDVQISREGNSLTVAPGAAVYVSANKLSSVNQLNQERLPLRNVVNQNAQVGAIYFAEFSIPVAMARIDAIRNAFRSSAGPDRKLTNDLIKMAAVLNMLQSNHGAFRNP